MVTTLGPADWLAPPRHPALGGHDVDLWRIELDVTPERIAGCVALLSAEETARMDAHGPPLLRARFAVRRAVVRTILGGYLGRDPGRLVFGESAYGRPELEAEPGRAGLRFSLSHSEDLAVLAVTPGRDVGVDVEKVRTLTDADGVARTVFSPAELAELRALPESARTVGFFNGWTRKEAWLKARGEGFAGEAANVDVTLAPGLEPRVLRVAGSPDEAAAWSLLAFVPREGFVGAVAARERACRVRAWTFGAGA